jgi:hypothetical protein
VTEPVDLLAVAKADAAMRARAVLGLSSIDSEKAVYEAVEVVFGLLHGHLRGRVPLPVPVDLMAVVASAVIRQTEALNRHNYIRSDGLNMESTPPLTNAVGTFTFTERVVLHRYRKLTV